MPAITHRISTQTTARFGRNIICLKVGRSKSVFRIHEDLLCERSPYFRCVLQPKHKDIDGDCPICLDDLKDTAKDLTYCMSCGGNFHFECMKKMRKHTSVSLRCPLCRYNCNNQFRRSSASNKSKSFADLDPTEFGKYSEWLYREKVTCEDSFSGGDFKPLVSAYLFSVEVEDRKFGTAVLQAMLEICKDTDNYPDQEAIALAYSMDASASYLTGARRLRTFMIDLYLAVADATWFEDEDWQDYPQEFLRDFAVAMLMQHPRKNKWSLDTWKAKLEVEEDDQSEDEEDDEAEYEYHSEDEEDDEDE